MPERRGLLSGAARRAGAVAGDMIRAGQTELIVSASAEERQPGTVRIEYTVRCRERGCTIDTDITLNNGDWGSNGFTHNLSGGEETTQSINFFSFPDVSSPTTVPWTVKTADDSASGTVTVTPEEPEDPEITGMDVDVSGDGFSASVDVSDPDNVLSPFSDFLWSLSGAESDSNRNGNNWSLSGLQDGDYKVTCSLVGGFDEASRNFTIDTGPSQTKEFGFTSVESSIQAGVPVVDASIELVNLTSSQTDAAYTFRLLDGGSVLRSESVPFSLFPDQTVTEDLSFTLEEIESDTTLDWEVEYDDGEDSESGSVQIDFEDTQGESMLTVDSYEVRPHQNIDNAVRAVLNLGNEIVSGPGQELTAEVEFEVAGRTSSVTREIPPGEQRTFSTTQGALVPGESVEGCYEIVDVSPT